MTRGLKLRAYGLGVMVMGKRLLTIRFESFTRMLRMKEYSNDTYTKLLKQEEDSPFDAKIKVHVYKLVDIHL